VIARKRQRADHFRDRLSSHRYRTVSPGGVLAQCPFPEAHRSNIDKNAKDFKMRVFNDPATLAAFKQSTSPARFSTYLAATRHDELKALELYFWNVRLAGELMFVLQTFEVCLRNRLNEYLTSRFGPRWPGDPRALRQLTAHDRRRLTLLMADLQTRAGGRPPSTDRIVSELSLGFWVSLLTRSYIVPFGWHGPGLRTVFPNDPTLTQSIVYQICNDARLLRNRVAHNEPLFRMPIGQIRTDLDRILNSMCIGSAYFANVGCRVLSVLSWRP
jgi:hypothetical protein